MKNLQKHVNSEFKKKSVTHVKISLQSCTFHTHLIAQQTTIVGDESVAIDVQRYGLANGARRIFNGQILEAHIRRPDPDGVGVGCDESGILAARDWLARVVTIGDHGAHEVFANEVNAWA
ncbi:hypothetical protein [Candidatus Cardinium hertigii]|uniref:hypothetical protein n=1 Tax=Candidatus Cardinium hertigii TaxID=247481 RepID=UPI00295004DE|nr:hypothetical protein [Candidatus Cardinium hertigii]